MYPLQTGRGFPKISKRRTNTHSTRKIITISSKNINMAPASLKSDICSQLACVADLSTKSSLSQKSLSKISLYSSSSTKSLSDFVIAVREPSIRSPSSSSYHPQFGAAIDPKQNTNPIAIKIM